VQRYVFFGKQIVVFVFYKKINAVVDLPNLKDLVNLALQRAEHLAERGKRGG
jgi:hypothetical protein